MSAPEASVEVVYALPERQRVVRLALRDGMTVRDALQAAGLEREFPELAGGAAALGIFGRRVEPAEPLKDGDRVEIYRPLKFDPRDARRRAARTARTAKRPGP